jgi:hypothetical protein
VYGSPPPIGPARQRTGHGRTAAVTGQPSGQFPHRDQPRAPHEIVPIEHHGRPRAKHAIRAPGMALWRCIDSVLTNTIIAGQRALPCFRADHDVSRSTDRGLACDAGGMTRKPSRPKATRTPRHGPGWARFRPGRIAMWALLSSRLGPWLLVAVVAPGVLLALHALRIQWERRVGPSTATRMVGRLEGVGARVIGVGPASGHTGTPMSARVRGSQIPRTPRR